MVKIVQFLSLLLEHSRVVIRWCRKDFLLRFRFIRDISWQWCFKVRIVNFIEIFWNALSSQELPFHFEAKPMNEREKQQTWPLNSQRIVQSFRSNKTLFASDYLFLSNLIVNHTTNSVSPKQAWIYPTLKKILPSFSQVWNSFVQQRIKFLILPLQNSVWQSFAMRSFTDAYR